MILTGKSKRAAAALGLSMLLFVPVQSALADSADMQVQVGWDGAYKSDAWTTVRVTITNKEKDMAGKLIVKPRNQFNGGIISSQFEKEVVIPQGGTKTITLEVPGALLDQSAEVVLENKSGDVVESTSSFIVNPVRQGLLIGSITAKKDDLNFLSLVNIAAIGGTSQVRYLNTAEIPAKSDVLKGLDLLVVNHAPQDKLTAEQTQAIRAWVEKGGRLLLSGGGNYAGGAALFNDLSPVDVTDTQELSNLSGLQAFTGAAPNAAKLTVSTGQLRPDSQVLIRSGDVPVLAKRQIGSGTVLYAAYDLSEEPLASWQGNKELWGRALSSTAVSTQNTAVKNGMSAINNTQQLLQASSLFETLTPSVVKNGLIYGAYIVVVGPLLYFLLKRVKRREWAWALIPASAAIFAFGIFMLNANQRAGGAIGQFAGVVDLKSDKTAEFAGAGSFIITRGGNYTVQFIQSSQVFAANGYGPPQSGSSRVLQSGDRADIQFNNVEYWSTRSAFTEGTLSNLGNFQTDLQVSKDGQLMGTVSNQSRFDLENAFIIAGNSPLSIGTLKAGQTVKVDQKIVSNGVSTSQKGTPFPHNIIQGIFPYQQTSGVDHHQQERSVLQYAMLRPNAAQSALELFGFSHSPLDIYTIKSVSQKEKSNLMLVHQELPLKFQQNSAVPGLIKPKTIEPQGEVDMNGDGYSINNGSVTFLYDVKLAKNFTGGKITTDLDNGVYNGLEQQLYNWKINVWETVSKETAASVTGDNLSKYVSADGNVWIKLSASGGGHYLCPVPSVGVEGEVAQ